MTPRALGHWSKWPGTSDRPRGFGQCPYMPGKSCGSCGTSDMGPSHLGQLIDPVGTWTQARVTQDFWSNPRGHGPGPQLPRKTDSHRGPLFTVPFLPGQLVDTVCPPAQARFSRDCCSTP